MNSSAFAAAVNSIGDKLLGHALSFTRDEDDARDLVQDTIVKAIRFSHQFDNETNLSSWLYVIMRNTFINQYHKEKRRRELLTTEEEISTAHLALSASNNTSTSNFALKDIQKAFDSLHPRLRKPFIRHFEGYKYDEIANELNIPLGTVKTRIHEARSKLKKYLTVYER